MLNRVGVGRHLVVGGSVVAVSLLGTLGVVGAGDDGALRSEHFDAKEVTVRPDGGDAVRIREVVDIDFGSNQRRGYQRIIPNDFGEPVDVTATSPDANDDLDIIDFGLETRIRIGDPEITFTGQRRYVLEYTLPEARLSTGQLALDIIGTDETFETDRFEVVLAGFDIADVGEIACDVGRPGQFGGCDFDEVDGVDGDARTVIRDLRPGCGISVFAPIGDVGPAEFAPPPPPPERRPTFFPIAGALQFLVATLTAIGIFVWFRRRGSNEVFGSGGAADAAFVPSPAPLPPPAGMSHELPVPSPGDWIADVPTYHVPDNRFADLATIEFVPPRGVEPWQGNLLLRERTSDDAVSAWFSEMVARGAIEIRGTGKDMSLHPGQTDARLSAVDRGHLATLFRSAPVVELGTYDAGFASVWKGVRSEQERFMKDCGWWHRHFAGTPGLSDGAKVLFFLFAVFGVFSAGLVGLFIAVALGVLGTLAGALLTAFAVALVVAAFSYATMLASRTAVGSALTLRTESFRRFLAASEGRHVDWAWEQGLIREYSAWAVALGAADAWSRAIESSNVAQPERFTAPLLLHTYSSALASSYTAPSSSGSGGGGGGFGGGVGGGGGGGSSGSW